MVTMVTMSKASNFLYSVVLVLPLSRPFSRCYNDFHLSIEFYRRKKNVKLSEFAEKWPYVQSLVTEVPAVEQVVS